MSLLGLGVTVVSKSTLGLNVILGLSFFLQTQVATADDMQAEKNPREKKIHIDVTRGVPEFDENMTRIFSLVTEIEYIDESSNQTIKLKSEFSGPNNDQDCENYDVDNKYSAYYFLQPTEIAQADKPPYSNWFEGRRLPGKVVKKTTIYCFAH